MTQAVKRSIQRSVKPPPRAYAIEKLVFASRWLQAPLYIGLIAAQAVYAYKFLIELKNMFLIAMDGDVSGVMLMMSVLGLIDVVMVANLLAMVIIGGYETFVSRLDLEGHPDQPDWLSHITPGNLKVKLCMAIIGVSSVHLLKTFVNIENIPNPNQTIFWQIIIQVVILLSAYVMVIVDKQMNHSLILLNEAEEGH